ncbi:hypothetical protein ACFL1R_09845 [Candidatus Latescibacterota bacterium]
MIIYNIRLPVMIHRKVLLLKQYPEPAPSAVGSTDVFVYKNKIFHQTAMHTRKAFLRKQYPDPAPNRIGEEDLPGGFERERNFLGQSQPLHDLAGGIVQVDNIKVLFDVKV